MSCCRHVHICCICQLTCIYHVCNNDNTGESKHFTAGSVIGVWCCWIFCCHTGCAAAVQRATSEQPASIPSIQPFQIQVQTSQLAPTQKCPAYYCRGAANVAFLTFWFSKFWIGFNLLKPPGDYDGLDSVCMYMTRPSYKNVQLQKA